MKTIFKTLLIAIATITATRCSDDSYPVPPASTVPKFTYAIDNDAFAPATATFTNNSIVPERAGTVAYTWNFGDGTSSSEASPTHKFVAPGAYSVNLVVVTSESLEIKETTQTVVVRDPNATGTPLFFTDGSEVFGSIINSGAPIAASLGITSLQDSYGMAVDTVNDKLYIADFDAKSIFVSDLDGKNYATFRSNIGQPDAVVIDYETKTLYWDTDSGIRKADMTNTDVNQFDEFVTGHSADDPEGMAIDPVSRTMFWNNYNGNVWTKKLDGTGEKLLITNGGGGSIIVVGSKIYFDDYVASGDIQLRNANFDGTGIATVATSITRVVYGLGYDKNGQKIYWVDRNLNKISRSNLDGTSTETWLSTSSSPRGIAIGKKK
ncbi:PKD domain-containing protein [Chryseolinea sp. T2]|uniref:PKD domain-containing protein n=1 Tax=Chryseolinea sp. T2 TaxID=3129255 RepID=UPI00307896A1